MQRKFKVEFHPHLRKIHVYSSKIVSTARKERLAPYNVRYRAPMPLAMGVAVILVLLLVLAGAPVFGFLTPIFVLLTLAVVAMVENRRKGGTIAQLKQLMPEERVVEAVKDCLELCASSESERVTVERDNIVFEALCGYPGKCVEYDAKRARVLLSVYGVLTVSIILSYYYLPSYVFIGVLLASLAVIVATANYKICLRYEVKKVFSS